MLNTSRLATLVQLLPRDAYDRERAAGAGDWEFGGQRETPFGMRRMDPIETARGIPCNPPPWGTLAAVNLATGTLAWEVPLGHLPEGHPLMALAGPPPIGTPTSGGPIVTAGGLVFIAATMDQRLRAFDLATGREVWHATLPFAGIATPMTYQAAGRQFVVIAAGATARPSCPSATPSWRSPCRAERRPRARGRYLQTPRWVRSASAAITPNAFQLGSSAISFSSMHARSMSPLAR